MKKADRDAQVLGVLARGPASFIEVAEAIDANTNIARDTLKRLHADRRAHIARYDGARGAGLLRPYYAIGDGQDARKPMGNPRAADTVLEIVAEIVAQKQHGA